MRDITELHLTNTKGIPSDAEVLEVEEYTGFPLPTPYLEFLKVGNGGHPEVDTFETKDEQWSVSNFFFVGSDTSSVDSVLFNLRKYGKGFPHSFLPIARDGFGNRFLLDLTTEGTGEVWIWVLDSPDQQLVKLTDRFEDFIDLLKQNPDYI